MKKIIRACKKTLDRVVRSAAIADARREGDVISSIYGTPSNEADEVASPESTTGGVFLHALRRNFTLATIIVLFAGTATCGGGIPIAIRIDEFTIDFDVGETITNMLGQLQSSGVLGLDLSDFPDKWPDELPDIRYSTKLETPLLPIDLSPDDAAGQDKYESINKYADAIERIEFNHLVLRLEENTLTIKLPALTLQAADKVNSNVNDRRAWNTIGTLPEAKNIGQPEDLTFAYARGGESYFASQLSDESKELALRAVGTLVFDTNENPRRPSGKVKLRLIAEVTFFIRPEVLL